MHYLEELGEPWYDFMDSFILKAFYEHFQVVRITWAGQKKEIIFYVVLGLGGRL